MNDWDLLQSYVADKSEEAFAELVRRYLGLVYSAAFRQVRSRELAEEVTQSVFTDLAIGAERLRKGTILGAWLYEVTRRTAVDVVRRESRRQRREKLAQEITHMDSTSPEWTGIEPLLDDAMAELGELDRTAVLLRYFENKSLQEIGERIGASEDATQKRVTRAIERLRQHLVKRGVAIGVSALIATLAANAAGAAPAALSVAATTNAALAGAAIKSSAVIGLTKGLAMTTAQKAVVGAIVVVAIGAGIYQARRATALKAEVAELKARQSMAGVGAPTTTAKPDGDATAAKMAALQEENDRLRKELADLPRLRGEVARLRFAQKGSGSGTDQQEQTAYVWLDRVDRLKQRLEQEPANKIPEFALLTDQDWLDAARGKLETDADYRGAMSRLRWAAENNFVQMLKPALDKFLKANNRNFPTEMEQLLSSFKNPVDAAILERYEIVPAMVVDNVRVGGDWIITQKQAVDVERDTRWVIGPNGYGSTSFYSNVPDRKEAAKLEQILTPVLKSYMTENNGKEPIDPEQLRPYLTTPEQQSAFENALNIKMRGMDGLWKEKGGKAAVEQVGK